MSPDEFSARLQEQARRVAILAREGGSTAQLLLRREMEILERRIGLIRQYLEEQNGGEHRAPTGAHLATVTIQRYDLKSGRVLPAEGVSGCLLEGYPGLVITQTPDEQNTWTITHMASGKAVAVGFRSMKRAAMGIQKAASIKVDWTLADNKINEAPGEYNRAASMMKEFLGR